MVKILQLAGDHLIDTDEFLDADAPKNQQVSHGIVLLPPSEVKSTRFRDSIVPWIIYNQNYVCRWLKDALCHFHLHCLYLIA